MYRGLIAGVWWGVIDTIVMVSCHGEYYSIMQRFAELVI